MREIRTSGSVGGEGGNILTYPAFFLSVNPHVAGAHAGYGLLKRPTCRFCFLLGASLSDAFRTMAAHTGARFHDPASCRAGLAGVQLEIRTNLLPADAGLIHCPPRCGMCN